MNLSQNFTLDKALYSKTANKLGIINAPSPAELETMHKTAVGMERVRALLGNLPIRVTSWFRCHALNLAVGSKESSQHRKGEAVDFTCDKYGSPMEICTVIAANADLIRYDQLILENGWVHISFAIVSRAAPRKQVITITPDGKPHPGLLYYV